jgi:hypothetical protein
MPYDPLTGLVSVFESADERTIDTELKKLEPRLFLVRQRDEWGQDFYEVRFWNGSETEPTLITDWREPNGKAKPLSSGLVYDVQRMMKRGPIDAEAIAARNQALQAKRGEEAQEMYEESARDFDRMRVLGNRVLMPRSNNVAANARRQALRDLERKFGQR